MSGKVGIALSGGIDSSCSAMILVDQGWEVEGFTFAPPSGDKSEKSELVFENASNVAKQLGIKHHRIDLTDDFNKLVIDQFKQGYLDGLTPNPCVICNRRIKWGVLRNAMIERGCDFMATGHYARISERDGFFILSKGMDTGKDQSYFLYFLDQSLLSKTLFPLGDFTKDEARNLLESKGIKITQSGESQDLCFIANEDDRIGLFDNLDIKPGEIRNLKGDVLGQHRSLVYYTVGQRRGLDIAHSSRLYVVAKNPDENTLVVGEREDIRQDIIRLTDFIISHPDYKNQTGKQIECGVKIRYRTKAVDASLEITTENGATVRFHNPVYGVASGQIGVAYDGDAVIGGGIISPRT